MALGHTHKWGKADSDMLSKMLWGRCLREDVNLIDSIAPPARDSEPQPATPPGADFQNLKRNGRARIVLHAVLAGYLFFLATNYATYFV